MKARQILVTGGILGCLGVVLGAFGAHWLEGAVVDWGLDSADQTKRLDTWEVAVRYQMYHALALLIAGVLATRGASNKLGWSAALFVVGTVIFSGCLYAYVFTGFKLLGAVVPIGGTCLIAGWVLLTMAGWSISTEPADE